MWNAIQKLRILLSPKDKWKLVGIVCLMAVGALAEIAGIGLILPVIAVFTKPELMEQNAILRFYASLVGGNSLNRLLIVTCLLIITVYVSKNILAFTVLCLQARFSSRKEYELCTRLFAVYMHAPYALHMKQGHLELGVMLLRAREVCGRIMLPFMCLSSDAMVILTLCSVLFISMPWVTLGTAGLLGIDAAAAYFLLRKYNYTIGEKYAQNIMAAERYSGDALRAIREVIVNGKMNFFIAQTLESRKLAAKYWMRIFSVGQIPRLWLETAAIIQLLLFFIAMLLFKVPHGTILLSFSLLLAAMSRMLPACSRINYNFTVIRQNLASAESVFEALQTVPEKVDGTTPLTFEKELVVEDLTFSYVPGNPVLKNFSLTIPRLASVAFTGTTGSGKSTLVDLLLGLLKPDSGAVKVDGRNIEENLASWRQKAGYVPQAIFLRDSSIRENVAFGIPPEEIDDEKIWQCLKMAQLDDFVRSLPEKLQSFVGDNGIKLSGGQRQRIGIARALYREPEILFLDEATSALDNETEQAFVDALKTLQGKLTIIMIAHRLSTVAHCDININLSGETGNSDEKQD